MDKSFLTVKELSLKLGVSEKTVYRMLTAKTIPFAIKIGGQWRFNSEKIEKWIADSAHLEPGKGKTNTNLAIAEALNRGLIIYRAHGENRDEVLDDIFAMLNSFGPEEVTSVKKQVLYKESIISSSLNGIAVMMPDTVEGYSIQASCLIMAFLEKAMDFKAIDGEKTEVVCLILPASRSEGLVLKTKLSRLLMEPSCVEILKSQPHRKQLTEQILAAEDSIMPRRDGTTGKGEAKDQMYVDFDA